MELDSSTDAVKEEHLPMEETDDSCLFQYFEIVPLATDTDGSCTTECVNGDWSAEVKQENSTVVKEEPDYVCFVISLSWQEKILWILENSLFTKYFYLYFVCVCGLQCFDAVGWAAGRASGL